MRPRTVSELAACVEGFVVGGRSDPTITEVVVDSREARPGAVFFALPGDRSDGHAFVHDALGRGAEAAVVRSGWRTAHTGLLVEVAETSRALLRLARAERDLLTATVVGITGSTGKTCTKDFTASVLAERMRVVSSPASFNNEVGLPLTLFQATEETQAIVCEMGSRGRGHIRLLCEVARPVVGVVTNVGVAHMELFGSPDVLRDAKAELPESLPPEGVAVLNADDQVVRSYADRTAATTVLFGTAPGAQIRAEDVSMADRTGIPRFRLVTPSGAADARLTVPGEHMVPNALAAAGVGWALGISPDEIVQGLADARVTSGRMEVHATSGGLRVVNDAYNANPTSMAAALRAARWMAGPGRCIAVLGPMAELGPIAQEEHLRVGELLVRLGIHFLVAVGADARLIASGAQHEGMEPDHIHLADDAGGAVDIVRSLARHDDLVLVKASRAARLERVAEALLADGDRAGATA